jgi:hypothetical protein
MINLQSIKEQRDKQLLELDTIEEVLKHYDKKGQIKGTSNQLK